MESNESKIGESRGNSLSSGDPNLKTNQGNTSTDSTSPDNSGESAPQTGENIVNEQEQNKSVNQEEFIENSAQNSFDDYEKASMKGSGDANDTDNKIPTMTSGAL